MPRFTREDIDASKIQKFAWGHVFGLEFKFLDLLPDFQWNLISVLGPTIAKADFFLPNYGLLVFLENSEWNS